MRKVVAGLLGAVVVTSGLRTAAVLSALEAGCSAPLGTLAEIVEAAGVVARELVAIEGRALEQVGDQRVDLVLAEVEVRHSSDLAAALGLRVVSDVHRLLPGRVARHPALLPHDLPELAVERRDRARPRLLRGFPVRAVAAFLEEHPKVEKIYYPGSLSHRQHDLAKRQQKGFGGMVAFDTGSLAGARAVLESVRLCTLAESLGGVETLISHPATMTHASVLPETRARLGITDGLVRISVGLEETEDIIADLDQALSKI